MLHPVLQPTRDPGAADTSGADGPPRYGQLLATTRQDLARAAAASRDGFPDLVTAALELAGYEQFLRVTGQHLQLLGGLTPPSTHLRELAKRLAGLTDVPAPATGAWRDVAASLAVAHDLVATHLSPDGRALTPQAADLTARRADATGVTDVLALLFDAITSGDQLLRRVADSQRDDVDAELVPSAQLNRLRHLRDAVDLYGKAALWDITSQAGPPNSDLATLEAAAPRLTAATRSRNFESTLAALAALRQISFHQGTGRASASVPSLADLCRLGTTLTHNTTSLLPEPQTPLEKLQHAHARDKLTTAHEAWRVAGSGLTTSIRGLTRAPAAYGRAITRLLADLDKSDTAQPDPPARTAILAALPRMASEASTAIAALTAGGALVTAERPAAALKVSWRHLTPDEGQALADRFLDAATATADADVVVHQLVSSRRPDARRPDAPLPAQRRDLRQTRELIR